MGELTSVPPFSHPPLTFPTLFWLSFLTSSSLLVEVSNTQPGLTSHSGRHLLFTRVAFGYQGAWLVGGDQLGNIYQLDLARNR